MEERKWKEKEFHNRLRDKTLRKNKPDYEQLTSNNKFYLITRRSRDFINRWLLQRCRNKRALDYCCGDGGFAILLARHGAEAVGIDISEVSIGNAKSKAIQEGVGNNSRFFVMDAEELQFDADCFDLVICGGVLHHLDIKKAYSELARVLKPDGEIICGEPLVHNPFIQLYRKRTPHLRTEWETEHILSKDSLELAKNYFGKVDVRCFHLAALAAVPFRNTPVFKFVLGFLEAADGFLLRLPLLKWQAWQVVFVLSQPKKPVIWEGRCHAEAPV